MNGYVPSVAEVLSCKKMSEFISLVKRDYGLPGIPQRVWQLNGMWERIYDHVVLLMEKDAFRK
jgi:hypothetical protein